MVGNAFGSVDTSFKPTQYIPQYQGVPLKEIADTSKILQDRYQSNIDAFDELEAKILSADVDEAFMPEKQAAIDRAKNVLQQVASNQGAWEKSQSIVRRAAKDFLGDEQFKLAQYNTKKLEEQREIENKLTAAGQTPIAFKSVLDTARDPETGKLVRGDYDVQPLKNYLPVKQSIANMINPDGGDIFQIVGGKKIVNPAYLKKLNETTFKNNPITAEDLNNITLLKDGKYTQITSAKIKQLEDKLLSAYKSTPEYEQERKVREQGLAGYEQTDNPDEAIKQSILDVAGLRVFRQEDAKRTPLGAGDLGGLLGKQMQENGDITANSTLADANNIYTNVYQNNPLKDQTLQDNKATETFNQEFKRNLEEAKTALSQSTIGIKNVNPAAGALMDNVVNPLASWITGLVNTISYSSKTQNLTPIQQQQVERAKNELAVKEAEFEEINPTNSNFKKLPKEVQEKKVNEFIEKFKKSTNFSQPVLFTDLSDPKVAKKVKTFNEGLFIEGKDGKEAFLRLAEADNLKVHDPTATNLTSIFRNIAVDKNGKALYESAKASGYLGWDNPYGIPSGYRVSLYEKEKGTPKYVFVHDFDSNISQQDKILNAMANAKYQQASGISAIPISKGKSKYTFFVHTDSNGERYMSFFDNNTNMLKEKGIGVKIKDGVKPEPELLNYMIKNGYL